MIAVVGPGDASPGQEAAAAAVGAGLARAGAVVVCGGLGGVMAAACRGTRGAGGTTVGLLPGSDPDAGNDWLDIVVPTGLGEGRNVLVVRSAAAVVAIGGGWGTLSEVALACRAGVPVIALGSWAPVLPGADASPVQEVSGPDEAVAAAVAAAPPPPPTHGDHPWTI